MTIRKEFDRQADEIRNSPVIASGEIVYDDSTKVKAGSKERGVSIERTVCQRSYRYSSWKSNYTDDEITISVFLGKIENQSFDEQLWAYDECRIRNCNLQRKWIRL